MNGGSTQLKGVISDVTIPSLTDSAEFGESEQEHPLVYDQVAPIANDAAGNRKALFLDELRNRSIKRINEDPVFHCRTTGCGAWDTGWYSDVSPEPGTATSARVRIRDVEHGL